VNFRFPEKNFTVLGESKFTVQIIEVNHNSFGCLFNLSEKYPETIQILKEFVSH